LEIIFKANAIEGYATDLSKPLLMPLSVYQYFLAKLCKKSRGEMASAVDNYLGEALGQLYVKNISESKKTHVGSS
jgi:putative endopeptidase